VRESVRCGSLFREPKATHTTAAMFRVSDALALARSLTHSILVSPETDTQSFSHSPSLSYPPRIEGGYSLADNSLACKRRRRRHPQCEARRAAFARWSVQRGARSPGPGRVGPGSAKKGFLLPSADTTSLLCALAGQCTVRVVVLARCPKRAALLPSDCV
jgi:hypothetical protein